MNHYVTGTTIKYLREKKNMTQAELADQIQVSDKTISKWETMRGLPDIALIEPLATEENAEAFFSMKGHGVVYAYCNQLGLYRVIV